MSATVLILSHHIARQSGVNRRIFSLSASGSVSRFVTSDFRSLTSGLSLASKQQYDQRNERERDEQDYQPPLSRRQQTGAGLIPGGNDPVGVVCQLHRIFVELTLGGRHLLRRRVLPLVEHDLGADGCAFRGDRFLVSGTRFRRQLLYAGVLLPVVLDLCFKVNLHLSDQSDRVRSWKSLARSARNFGRYSPLP